MADLNKYHNGQFNSNGHKGDAYLSSNRNIDHQKEDEFDFKKIFYVLWSRKYLIVGSILLLGLMAGILAFTSTPIYQSKGSMLIKDSQGSNPFGNSEGFGQLLSSTYGLGAGSTLANELQVLQSRKLSIAVADTLMGQRIMPNGRQYPLLFRSYPEDSTMTSQDTVAARIQEKISFDRVDREAEVIDIIFESPSPYEAAHVIDAAMNLYRNLSTQENRTSATSAVSFLEKERKRIQDNLQNSEQKLREFMNSSNLVEVEPQTKNMIDQIANLEAQKQEAKAKLVAVSSAIDRYQEELNKIKPGLAEQYSDAIGPNISKLQYAKSELELEKQQLLAKNPNLSSSSSQLQEINRQIKIYKNRIKSLTENLLEQSDKYLGFLGGGEAGVAVSISELNQKIIELQVEQKQYQSQVEVINEQLDEQQIFFNDLPDNIIDLAQLKRDVKINEELFVTVSQQYAETALWEQTQFGLGRIIDKAYIPKKPIKPNIPLYLLIGFIMGACLSIGYVLLDDKMNTTIESVETIKRLNEPLLSVIPTMTPFIKEEYDGDSFIKVQEHKISTSLITVLDSISPISESFRRLENNLIYSNPDQKLNSIMVTSSGKGEGKTTTISNLGVVLAEAGYNTLIVDTDFRRPNLHNMFGVQKTPGFIEILFDDVKIEETIKKSIIPGLSILTSGRRPPNAAAITQSKSFLNLINNLEDSYDFVLIDTPPFGIITDASAMMRRTDSVVVVAKFGATTEVQLNQTLEQLHNLHANVTGTVLTAFDHNESKDYYLNSNYYKKVYEDYNEYKKESSL